MRRSALLCLSIVSAGLLGGCTGTGVFFDHTFQRWGGNPNTPAGSSETFLRMRGQSVNVAPILPDTGNVWPTNTGPDLTLQDIEKQQNEEIRRNGGVPPAPGAGPASGPNPAINRANGADQGLPPPQTPPPPPRGRSAVPTPGGPSLDVGGGGPRGYRNLQTPSAPNGSANGGGILVPNGNGTSTLIMPDGTIQTVPTK